jgi:hypothetical protein
MVAAPGNKSDGEGPGALALLHGLPRQTLILLVRGYRLLLKPWLGNACRFEPTCSQYALDALHRHGTVVGAALTAGRILRCQPFCQGGCDPVPGRAPALFRALGLGVTGPDATVEPVVFATSETASGSTGSGLDTAGSNPSADAAPPHPTQQTPILETRS